MINPGGVREYSWALILNGFEEVTARFSQNHIACLCSIGYQDFSSIRSTITENGAMPRRSSHTEMCRPSCLHFVLNQRRCRTGTQVLLSRRVTGLVRHLISTMYWAGADLGLCIWCMTLNFVRFVLSRLFGMNCLPIHRRAWHSNEKLRIGWIWEHIPTFYLPIPCWRFCIVSM